MTDHLEAIASEMTCSLAALSVVVGECRQSGALRGLIRAEEAQAILNQWQRVERALLTEYQRLLSRVQELEQDVTEARRQRDEFRTKKPIYLPPPFDKQELTRRVAGAVDSAMAAHGPLTQQNKSSLTKRITGELYARQAAAESAEAHIAALDKQVEQWKLQARKNGDALEAAEAAQRVDVREMTITDLRARLDASEAEVVRLREERDGLKALLEKAGQEIVDHENNRDALTRESQQMRTALETLSLKWRASADKPSERFANEPIQAFNVAVRICADELEAALGASGAGVPSGEPQTTKEA